MIIARAKNLYQCRYEYESIMATSTYKSYLYRRIGKNTFNSQLWHLSKTAEDYES